MNWVQSYMTELLKTDTNYVTLSQYLEHYVLMINEYADLFNLPLAS